MVRCRWRLWWRRSRCIRWGAEAGGSGRNVDDGAAVASVFGGHAADGFAGTEKTSKNICGENAVEARGVDLIEARLAFDGAGVVDERGDGAELVGGGVEEADYVVFVADVGLNRDRGALFLVDGVDDFFGGFAVAEIVDADAVSAGGGEVGGGGSDAAACAGDDEDLWSGGHGGGILAGSGDGASPVSTAKAERIRQLTRQLSGRHVWMAFLMSALDSFSLSARAASAGSSASEAKRKATSCDSVSSAMWGRNDGSHKSRGAVFLRGG